MLLLDLDTAAMTSVLRVLAAFVMSYLMRSVKGLLGVASEVTALGAFEKNSACFQ